MAIEDAASGLETGNAGDVAPPEKGGLSAALDQALKGFDDEGDVPLTKAVDAKADRAAPRATKADAAEGTDNGKSRTSDPAAASAAKDAAASSNAALEPPKHWPQDRQQSFSKMPAEAQKAMLALAKDLEGGYTRKSMEVSDKVKFADSIGGLLSDDASKAQLARAGLDEVGYVRYLHSLQRFATQDPARYVAWAMQSLGVRPEHLGFGTAAPAAQQSQEASQLDDLLTDPALKELKQKFDAQSSALQQMQARFEEQASREREYAHSQQRQGQQRLVSMWQEFRAALDNDGRPAYPHADTVMRHMGALMDTDPDISKMSDGPDKLKAAYDAAIWAVPSLRNQQLEAQKAASDAAAQRARDAERAKRVAGPKRALGAPTAPAKKGGISGALDAAMTQLGIE